MAAPTSTGAPVAPHDARVAWPTLGDAVGLIRPGLGCPEAQRRACGKHPLAFLAVARDYAVVVVAQKPSIQLCEKAPKTVLPPQNIVWFHGSSPIQAQRLSLYAKFRFSCPDRRSTRSSHCRRAIDPRHAADGANASALKPSLSIGLDYESRSWRWGSKPAVHPKSGTPVELPAAGAFDRMHRPHRLSTLLPSPAAILGSRCRSDSS